MTYPSLASQRKIALQFLSQSRAAGSLYDITNLGNRCFSLSQLVVLINLFDRNRNALADADAHGCQGKLTAALLHAVHRRQPQPCAAHPERMAERDRAAMPVDEIGVALDDPMPRTGYALRGEG